MDVNNFGVFHSDVWGTVADWIIAIGTIVTIVYLILTFEKQKSLYRIEKERFRNSKKPIFDISIDNASYKQTPNSLLN